MLVRLHDLRSYTIQAADGEIGKIEEFLFDDESWVIRYLVVNTGNWLTGRKVLVSPIAVQEIDRESQQVFVSLTREKVEQSPDIDTDKPVSRQMETQYYNYYRWPYYWGGMGIWGLGSYPAAMLDYPYSVPPEGELRTQNTHDAGDPHLRSFKEVKGYGIEATDAKFGHLEDLVVEEDSWMVRYLVIDTVNYWPSKSVLVAPEWVNSISWADQKIVVDLTEDQVKKSPEFDVEGGLPREYEDRLYDHYGRSGYWKEIPPAGLTTSGHGASGRYTKRQIG